MVSNSIIWLIALWSVLGFLYAIISKFLEWDNRMWEDKHD